MVWVVSSFLAQRKALQERCFGVVFFIFIFRLPGGFLGGFRAIGLRFRAFFFFSGSGGGGIFRGFRVIGLRVLEFRV